MNGNIHVQFFRRGGGGNVTSLPDPQGSNPLGPPGPELPFPSRLEPHTPPSRATAETEELSCVPFRLPGPAWEIQ